MTSEAARPTSVYLAADYHSVWSQARPHDAAILRAILNNIRSPSLDLLTCRIAMWFVEETDGLEFVP